MKTFAVREILGRDLTSRPFAHDLYNYIENSGEREAVLDFAGVEFSSRSFMDEFYNLFVKDGSASIINMSPDLRTMLDVVESTQNRKKEVPASRTYYKAKSIEDMKEWFAIHSI